jgi:hypothetical protein
VKPSSVVVGYQRFGGPCCLHLHPEDRCNMALGKVRILSWRHNPEDEDFQLTVNYLHVSERQHFVRST